jgi:hypothetical protein
MTMSNLTTRSTAIGVLYGLLALALHAWGKYRSWWWFDNAAHLFAGISLGSLITTEDSSATQDALLVAGLTAGWELAEYWHGAYPWGDSDLPDRAAAEDTVLDTILVAIGAAIAIRGANDG